MRCMCSGLTCVSFIAHLDRQAVDQGADLHTQLVGVAARGELAGLPAAPHDLGDRLPPAPVQDLGLLRERRVAQRTHPDLDPQRPLLETLEVSSPGADRSGAELIARRVDAAEVARLRG
jgi:hypothetical protein